MSPVPAVILLMIVYMASLIGVTMPHQQAWFLYYTPYFMLLNALLLLFYQKHKTTAWGLFWGSCLLLGTAVELSALHTGALYGSYTFGESLGWKVMKMPVVMPLYWLVVVHSTAVVAARFITKPLGRLLLGTFLSLLLMVLIHLVAPRLDFWTFEAGALWRAVLVQGLVVALLQYLFVRWRVSSENAVAGYVYGGLLIFFVGVVSFLQ
jgi:putative membrane protein